MEGRGRNENAKSEGGTPLAGGACLSSELTGCVCFIGMAGWINRREGERVWQGGGRSRR